MEKSKIIFYSVIFMFVLSLLLFLIALYINSNVILERREIPATLIVGDTAGFDVNDSLLTFGVITYGTSSQKTLIAENNYDFPIRFEFSVKGNITQFLIFDKVIYLEGGEKKSVSISTIIPSNEEYGIYSGTMIIIIKKDLF